jgi:hypothetical protein
MPHGGRAPPARRSPALLGGEQNNRSRSRRPLLCGGERGGSRGLSYFLTRCWLDCGRRQPDRQGVLQRWRPMAGGLGWAGAAHEPRTRPVHGHLCCLWPGLGKVIVCEGAYRRNLSPTTSNSRCITTASICGDFKSPQSHSFTSHCVAAICGAVG